MSKKIGKRVIEGNYYRMTALVISLSVNIGDQPPQQNEHTKEILESTFT